MNTSLRTPVCKLLGCDVPIVLAGMGGVARSELVSAVTLAGGFGFLGMVRETAALIRQEVEAVRTSTDRPFGVNLIPAATPLDRLDEEVTACLERNVPIVGLFWDIRRDVIARLRDAGVTVVCQVGSVQEAERAQQAGAQILIVQGVEAGGHVRGTLPLATILPEVVRTSDVPVLAAGGIVDGRDLATALQAGAQGVVIGTAFLASPESFAHPYHKQRILDAGPDDTFLTETFRINWPAGAKVRVLRNSTTENPGYASARPEVIGSEEGRPIYRCSTDSPLRSMLGDFEAMALYAGGGVGRIDKLMRAGDRVRAIAAEATAILVQTLPAELRST